MLACDLILEARASRSLNAEQVASLERMVFSGGNPDRAQLDTLFLIDAYVTRADPSWGLLLARAALTALVAGPDADCRAESARAA